MDKPRPLIIYQYFIFKHVSNLELSKEYNTVVIVYLYSISLLITMNMFNLHVCVRWFYSVYFSLFTTLIVCTTVFLIVFECDFTYLLLMRGWTIDKML